MKFLAEQKYRNSIPGSTYRLQLNQHFKFTQACNCVSYLHALGITHCYASPYLKARPGSLHGYDIVDHNTLNPEIGSTAEFEQWTSMLEQQQMGLITDIVPNHMGVMGSDNLWWLDVLENGPASIFAGFFDIDWRPLKPELRNKLLIPVLGDHYGISLGKHEFQLSFDAESGEFSIYYFQHRFPIDPQTYPFILNARDATLLTHFDPSDPVHLEYQTLDNSLSKLPLRSEISPEKREERARDKEVFKKQLAKLCVENPLLGHFIEQQVAQINRMSSDSGALHLLMEQQAYRLAYWQVAGEEINYRRFFDINDLAGLRIEEAAVFEACHRYLLELIQQGKIDGLRIDHADGLYDPDGYYRRLNSAIATLSGFPVQSQGLPLCIVAEKIIADTENLSRLWEIHGTTGYEFAAFSNGIFIDQRAEKWITRTYTRFIGHRQDFHELAYRAKKYVMNTSLASALNMLANQLSHIAKSSPVTRDYTLNALREALAEIIASFPVYRTYIHSARIHRQDLEYIQSAVQQARLRSRAPDKTVFVFVRKVLLLELSEENTADPELLEFVMKFQLYTAPVMAKGVEDTALYEYNRLVSLNEVGNDPACFGQSVAAWHRMNSEQARKWPYGMRCLSSHDTKRSADVRSRINVLSEIPQQWHECVFRWHRINRMRINTKVRP